jgi:hypothetical protein
VVQLIGEIVELEIRVKYEVELLRTVHDALHSKDYSLIPNINANYYANHKRIEYLKEKIK